MFKAISNMGTQHRDQGSKTGSDWQRWEVRRPEQVLWQHPSEWYWQPGLQWWWQRGENCLNPQILWRQSSYVTWMDYEPRGQASGLNVGYERKDESKINSKIWGSHNWWMLMILTVTVNAGRNGLGGGEQVEMKPWILNKLILPCLSGIQMEVQSGTRGRAQARQRIWITL